MDGYQLTYRLVPDAGKTVTDADLATTIRTLQKRLETIGMQSPVVEKLPPDEVVVSVPPGSWDQAAILHLMGQAGDLSFVPLPSAKYGTSAAAGPVMLPRSGDVVDPTLPVLLVSADVDSTPSRTYPLLDTSTQSWAINVSLKSAGAAKLATWSTGHIGDYLAIVLDGKVLQVPFLQTEITDGNLEISGGFTQEGATSLATVLQLGSLPFPVKLVTSTANPAVAATFVIPVELPAGTGSVAPIVAPSATTPASLPSSGRALGDPAAPVTLDVWGDFQCPNCKNFAQTVLPQLVDKYVATGKVRVVYHDFIVIDSATGGHESADAANAARCAADQGEFWVFQDWLWANQGPEGTGAFSNVRLLQIGAQAGLDMRTFQPCVDADTHAAAVQAESASASTSMPGTPTVMLNGTPLSSYDFATVSAAIDLALSGSAATPPAADGPVATFPPSS